MGARALNISSQISDGDEVTPMTAEETPGKTIQPKVAEGEPRTQAVALNPVHGTK